MNQMLVLGKGRRSCKNMAADDDDDDEDIEIMI